jgi:hypothetical protein
VNIQITDPIGALVVLAILLIVGWSVAYSAARMATDDLRTIVLSLTAIDGPMVEIEVANHGMKAAYAVEIRDLGPLSGSPIATLGDIRPGAVATAQIERGALVGDPDRELPLMVRLAWRIDGPRGLQKRAPFPLGPAAARTEPAANAGSGSGGAGA